MPPTGWEALQDSAGWQLVVQEDSLRVYIKPLSVAPIPAMRVEVETTAPPEALLSLVWSVGRYSALFRDVYVSRSGILEQGFPVHVGWQVVDTPLLHPRLYVFKQIRSTLRIDWVQVPPDTLIQHCLDCVVPKLNFGSWEVIPFRGHIRVIYRVCTDPGGTVPVWLVDQANRRYLPEMLRLLVRAARSQKIKDE
jgi:hypothetical protein